MRHVRLVLETIAPQALHQEGLRVQVPVWPLLGRPGLPRLRHLRARCRRRPPQGPPRRRGAGHADFVHCGTLTATDSDVRRSVALANC